MNSWKRRQLQETASSLGLTLEEYLASATPEKKKAPPASEADRKRTAEERKRQADERKHHMAALSWAAQERGTTYGKLVGTLSPQEKSAVYKAYEEYQAARESEIDAQVKKTQAAIRRMSRPSAVDLGSRYADQSLTNSTVDKEREDAFST